MFNNPFSMVVAIVLIVSIAGVLRARYGIRRDAGGNEYFTNDPQLAQENAALRKELRAIKDRVAVLERLATDNHKAVELDREIERLRGQ